MDATKVLNFTYGVVLLLIPLDATKVLNFTYGVVLCAINTIGCYEGIELYLRCWIIPIELYLRCCAIINTKVLNFTYGVGYY